MRTIVSILIASFMTLVAVAALADRATSQAVEPERTTAAMSLPDRATDLAADESADREAAYAFEEDRDDADRIADVAADRNADREADYPITSVAEPDGSKGDLAADRAADQIMDREADYAVEAPSEHSQGRADADHAADIAADRNADGAANYAILEDSTQGLEAAWAVHMVDVGMDRLADREANYAVDEEPDQVVAAAVTAHPADAEADRLADKEAYYRADERPVRIVEDAWAVHVADVEADRAADTEANYAVDEPQKLAADAMRGVVFSSLRMFERAAQPFVTAREIAGGSLILPTSFVPYGPGQAKLAASPAPDKHEARADATPANQASPSLPAEWSMPLMERPLGPSRKAESLAPELQNAINRIEPMYDPTRVEGSVDAIVLRVSPGTASLSDVFGEHWHLAADDPTLDLKVSRIGLAWRMTSAQPCDAFTKKRRHEVGDVALTALSSADCVRLQRRQALGFNDAAPVPIVSAPISLATFAAPMAGARLSHEDFWAAQKARVEAIEARLQERLHPPQPSPAQIGLRL